MTGTSQKSLRSLCPSSRHFVTRRVVSTEKSLFDIVQPTTLRKPESDTDRGDDTQVKKRKFCPKWLEELGVSMLMTSNRQITPEKQKARTVLVLTKKIVTVF